MMCLLLFLDVTEVSAQTLDGVDDDYGVPFGKTLQIETFGVLENDILNGEPAGENGALAELLTSVNSGSLECPTEPTMELCVDGSFNYTPGPSFSGSDSFTYQAVFGGVISTPVTVSLTACTGGPQIYSCWKESSYRSKLAELNYGIFREGFEGAAWDIARWPSSVTSVTSKGIIWSSNHPDTNTITTGPGPALTGQWGVFDPNHGSATGNSTTCDVDNPPQACLYHDGISGKTQPGGAVLHGVGAYITGFTGADIAFIIGGGPAINVGKLGSAYQFFGVIDAGFAGFTAFEVVEQDGKIGQALYIWADDFLVAASGIPPNTIPFVLLKYIVD